MCDFNDHLGINEQSSNKSGTIEMYAPSSFNETMTGETLSSVSEKSETYSDSRQDYVSVIIKDSKDSRWNFFDYAHAY